MKRLSMALTALILIWGCDDSDRGFTSPTSLGPFTVVLPTPTPTPVVVAALYPVHGVVYEMTGTGKTPIEGAWVTESSEFHAGVYTAADGSYRFEGLYEGDNWFNVSKDGYHSISRLIAITGDLRLDFELVRR